MTNDNPTRRPNRYSILPLRRQTIVSNLNLFRLYQKTSDTGVAGQSSYEELLQIENERKKLNSQCEESSLKILTHLRGTLLMEIFLDFFFWFTLLTYVVFRTLVDFDFLPAPAEEKINSAIFYLVFIAGFLISFLLSYEGRNTDRYFEFLDETWDCTNRINDVATLAKVTLPFERAHRIVRYLNAAHIAAYTGTTNAYHKSNFFDPLVGKYALLDKKELKRVCVDMDVEKDGIKAAMEILTWVMRDIRSAYEAKFLDSEEANQMRDLVLQLRSTFSRMKNKKSAPVPFMFHHFLTLLSAVYLPIFALAVAFEAGSAEEATSIQWHLELVKAILIIFQTTFIIGLRVAGQQESEPYGTQLIDIQLLSYIKGTLDESFCILEAAEFEPPDFQHEMNIKNERNLRESHISRELECLSSQLENQQGSHSHLFRASFGDDTNDGIDIECNRNFKSNQNNEEKGRFKINRVPSGFGVSVKACEEHPLSMRGSISKENAENRYSKNEEKQREPKKKQQQSESSSFDDPSSLNFGARIDDTNISVAENRTSQHVFGLTNLASMFNGTTTPNYATGEQRDSQGNESDEDSTGIYDRRPYYVSQKGKFCFDEGKDDKITRTVSFRESNVQSKRGKRKSKK